MHCIVNEITYIANWLSNGTDYTCKHKNGRSKLNDGTLTTSLAKCYEIW